MRVRIYLGAAILISEYLDFHSGYSLLPGAE